MPTREGPQGCRTAGSGAPTPGRTFAFDRYSDSTATSGRRRRAPAVLRAGWVRRRSRPLPRTPFALTAKFSEARSTPIFGPAATRLRTMNSMAPFSGTASTTHRRSSGCPALPRVRRTAPCRVPCASRLDQDSAHRRGRPTDPEPWRIRSPPCPGGVGELHHLPHLLVRDVGMAADRRGVTGALLGSPPAGRPCRHAVQVELVEVQDRLVPKLQGLTTRPVQRLLAPSLLAPATPGARRIVVPPPARSR